MDMQGTRGVLAAISAMATRLGGLALSLRCILLASSRFSLLIFSRKQAFPGLTAQTVWKHADWTAQSYDDFENSIADRANELIAKFFGDD